jgi:hypothetical protein
MTVLEEKRNKEYGVILAKIIGLIISSDFGVEQKFLEQSRDGLMEAMRRWRKQCQTP